MFTTAPLPHSGYALVPRSALLFRLTWGLNRSESEAEVRKILKGVVAAAASGPAVLGAAVPAAAANHTARAYIGTFQIRCASSRQIGGQPQAPFPSVPVHIPTDPAKLGQPPHHLL